MYRRIRAFFSSKDAKNNFCEENEQSTPYRDALDKLDELAA